MNRENIVGNRYQEKSGEDMDDPVPDIGKCKGGELNFFFETPFYLQSVYIHSAN
jgi:hypothetical protein